MDQPELLTRGSLKQHFGLPKKQLEQNTWKSNLANQRGNLAKLRCMRPNKERLDKLQVHLGQPEGYLNQPGSDVCKLCYEALGPTRKELRPTRMDLGPTTRVMANQRIMLANYRRGLFLVQPEKYVGVNRGHLS